MACELIFEPPAVRALDRLDATVRKRIIEKLEWFAAQNDPLDFAVVLSHPDQGTHRFRIGDWRVIVDDRGHQLGILDVGHRREIYRS